jgi:hypothetical protein
MPQNFRVVLSHLTPEPLFRLSSGNTLLPSNLLHCRKGKKFSTRQTTPMAVASEHILAYVGAWDKEVEWSTCECNRYRGNAFGRQPGSRCRWSRVEVPIRYLAAANAHHQDDMYGWFKSHLQLDMIHCGIMMHGFPQGDGVILNLCLDKPTHSLDFFCVAAAQMGPTPPRLEVSKSHSDTPHSAGLLWTRVRPIAYAAT